MVSESRGVEMEKGFSGRDLVLGCLSENGSSDFSSSSGIEYLCWRIGKVSKLLETDLKCKK